MQVCVSRPTPANRRTTPAKAAAPRPAFIILAQYEHGLIVAAVSTNPAIWKDEEVRLHQSAFGEFQQFAFSSIAAATHSIEKLGREITRRFGRDRLTADQSLAKLFQADWPIVLDLMKAEHKLAS